MATADEKVEIHEVKSLGNDWFIEFYRQPNNMEYRCSFRIPKHVARHICWAYIKDALKRFFRIK